jgi:RNA polymerase sigma factor for flagellar operon FliA
VNAVVKPDRAVTVCRDADRLVRQHAELVKRIAYHLCARLPPSVEVDDLIQAGMLGLLEAAGHFAEGKGASFETFAGIRIRGAMIDALRKLDWAPRSVHRRSREVAQAIRDIERETGAEARAGDIAARLGIGDPALLQNASESFAGLRLIATRDTLDSIPNRWISAGNDNRSFRHN